MSDKLPKQGRGCFFYGAITMGLVLIGVIVGVYFGSRKAILSAVATYTSPNPMPIRQLNLPPREKERIARNLARAAQAAAQGNGPKQIELGEQELNSILSVSPDLKAFSDQIYLRPDGGKLQAEVSLPLDQFEHWRNLGRKIRGDVAHRYLNGTALFDVGITNGTLSLTLADLIVNGKSLPAEFTKRVQSQNFASAANTNAEAQAIFKNVESITIQDGKVRAQFK